MANEENNLKNASDESVVDELISRLKLDGEDAAAFRAKVLSSLGWVAKPVWEKPKKSGKQAKKSFWGSDDDDDDDFGDE